MYLKLLFTFITITLSSISFAGETEVVIAMTKVGVGAKVDSFLKVDKLDRLYVLIATKKSRRGMSGCFTHRGTMSTKSCQVTTEKIGIHELSINRDNEIIFNKNGLNVMCGGVKDIWLGRKIILNDSCKLIDYEETLEEDDGIEIHKVRYAITKFVVED